MHYINLRFTLLYFTLYAFVNNYVIVAYDLPAASKPLQPSPSTAAQRKAQRRITRMDNRYHSGEIVCFCVTVCSYVVLLC